MNPEPPPPPPPVPGFPPPPPGTPPKTAGMATASLICGIMSIACLGCFAGVPAIICGHVAQGRIGRSNGTLGGSGMALAGLIMGYVSLALSLVLVPLLSAIAVPNFLRARKRSQATVILNELRLIDVAIDQYAIVTNKKDGAAADWADIQQYLKPGTRLYNSNHTDILGGDFGATFTVDTLPAVPDTTFNELSDVAPAEFWSPYISGR